MIRVLNNTVKILWNIGKYISYGTYHFALLVDDMIFGVKKERPNVEDYIESWSDSSYYNSIEANTIEEVDTPEKDDDTPKDYKPYDGPVSMTP